MTTKKSEPNDTAKTAKPSKPVRQKLTLPDAGFHIAVLGALLDAELVTEEALERHLEGIDEDLDDVDEDDMDERLTIAMKRLHAFPLEPSRVAQITSLDFDGGNEIYMSLEGAAGTESGGETDVYSLQSLEGIGALSGLESLDLDAHGCPAGNEARDLEPLRDHPALTSIILCDCKNADALLTLPKLAKVRLLGAVDVVPDVLSKLEAKGVTVQRL